MDYTTPGSAVSDVVQQILERRRNLERQGLMDQLGVAKYKADEADKDRTFGLQQQAEARAGRVADANIAADKFRIVHETAADMPFGEADVSDTEQSNPDLFKYLMDTHRIRKENVTPSVSFGTDFQPPADATPEQLDSYAQQLEAQGPQEGRVQLSPTQTGRSIYTGSDKFQQAEDERKRIEALMTDPAFRSTDPLTVLLTGAKAGVNVPGAALPTNDTIVGPNGRTIQTIHGRGGDTITHLPYPPQATAANRPQYVGTSPNGDPVVMNPDGSFRIAPLPSGDPIKAKPSATNQDIIPVQLITNLRAAKANPNGNRRAELVSSAMAGIKTSAMQRGVPPEVVDTASGLADDMAKFKAAGKPVPTIEDYVKAGSLKATPEEINKLKTILPVFLEQ